MGKDWKSRMFVSVQTAEGQKLLSPIIDINPVFNTPHTPEHSLEADSVGITKGNDTFTFSLTCKALRDEDAGTNPAKLLTNLQLRHKPFNIILVERQTEASNGKEWGFNSILLQDCYVNNSSPSRAIINGSPVAVFNCMALGVNVDGEFFNGTIPA